jgi:hypothetical protein
MSEADQSVMPAVESTGNLTSETDPWVSDLHSGFAEGQCQSTVGFDNHPCEGGPTWYVELEVQDQPVANPQWEGKLCNACLAGWIEWSSEDPDSVVVVSVNPIISD